MTTGRKLTAEDLLQIAGQLTNAKPTDPSKQWSEAQKRALVEEYIDANAQNKQKIIAQAEQLVAEGAFTAREMNDLEEKILAERAANGKGGNRPTQQTSKPAPLSSPQSSPKPQSSTNSDAATDRLLRIGCRIVRIIIALLNMVPYCIGVTLLLERGIFGDAYTWLTDLFPFSAWVFRIGLGAPIWLVFQCGQNQRRSILLRSLAYVFDAAFCILAFPPIQDGSSEGIRLFASAPTIGDVRLLEVLIIVFSVRGWEAWNWVESQFFPGERIGFWGVSLK